MKLREHLPRQRTRRTTTLDVFKCSACVQVNSVLLVELQHWMYLNGSTEPPKHLRPSRTTTLDVFKYAIESALHRQTCGRTTTLDVFK